nr:hypothetical protein [Sphingomonas sp.]
MTNVEALDARPDAGAGYKVDVSRGQRVGRVSSEWFNRPDDQRYLSLDELFASVKGRSERSRTRTVESASVRVEAGRDDAERLSLILPGSDAPIAPTHWSFGQLASLVGAPAAYLRQLPAALAGINLQYGLTSHRAEQVKTLETDDGRVELRAVTGPDYGRIYDHELVEAVRKIAGNGTGDTRWKVPGVLDWSTGVYNPRVDVTKDTTTLYASDRDVFGSRRVAQCPDGAASADRRTRAAGRGARRVHRARRGSDHARSRGSGGREPGGSVPAVRHQAPPILCRDAARAADTRHVARGHAGSRSGSCPHLFGRARRPDARLDGRRHAGVAPGGASPGLPGSAG